MTTMENPIRNGVDTPTLLATLDAVKATLRTGRIDSTGYYYGTAAGWSKLDAFARVPGDQSRVSDRPEEDR